MKQRSAGLLPQAVTSPPWVTCMRSQPSPAGSETCRKIGSTGNLSSKDFSNTPTVISGADLSCLLSQWNLGWEWGDWWGEGSQPQCWGAASSWSELSALPQQAGKDSPVNVIPEPCTRGLGSPGEGRFPFARLPGFPMSCCVCTHSGVCSGECKEVLHQEGSAAFLLSQQEELARAPSGECGADVLAVHLHLTWARLLAALVVCFPLSTLLFC